MGLEKFRHMKNTEDDYINMSIILFENTGELNYERRSKMYQYKGSVIRVVDGDTYDIEIDLGFHTKRTERFRLMGIDTPETWRPKSEAERTHGLKANEFVRRLIEDETVTLSSSKSSAGIYGRYECSIQLKDGRDLATLLKTKGFEKLESYEE